ncbi:MAG: AAA family ATPase, partial [Bdellovibrionales bacterium]|nr:AAA family ATPase [Bdellovibrionales bacterium]
LRNSRDTDNAIFEKEGYSASWHGIKREWESDENSLPSLGRWFCKILDAEKRLTTANPAENIPFPTERPREPIHYLQRNDELEKELSKLFRKAFGLDLIVHRNAGTIVPLHVGERPKHSKKYDRVSQRYIEKLEKLPTLQSEGDGMRSFAGVILASSVGEESVLLIDEPEAFLHPPQARLLGNIFVDEKPDARQLFIATHSTDILQGILDRNSSDVRVLRINRTGSINKVSILDNSVLKQLWQVPLLRSSNIFDGLFHKGVVICEGDSDCRFYSTLLQALCNDVDSESNTALCPDLHFVHCGGKARLATVATALRALDVPVKVVADFDILSSIEPLGKVVEAVGVTWSSIKSDWKEVKSAIDRNQGKISIHDGRQKLLDVLDSSTDPELYKKVKKCLDELTRKSDPLKLAKSNGISMVPSGEPRRKCEKLFEIFRKAGLHIVEDGELESFNTD